MKWNGTKPIVCGLADEETGQIMEEIVVLPGEEIPEAYAKEIKSKNADWIGRFGDYNPEEIKQFYSQKNKSVH